MRFWVSPRRPEQHGDRPAQNETRIARLRSHAALGELSRDDGVAPPLLQLGLITRLASDLPHPRKVPGDASDRLARTAPGSYPCRWMRGCPRPALGAERTSQPLIDRRSSSLPSPSQAGQFPERSAGGISTREGRGVTTASEGRRTPPQMRLLTLMLRSRYEVLRSRSATSSAFSSARWSALASSSLASPLRSSLTPSRRSAPSFVMSPAACLTLPVILSVIPPMWGSFRSLYVSGIRSARRERGEILSLLRRQPW
jgi:hypothetical protein